RVTAQQENGRLARGTPAAEIPVYDWYDDALHLEVIEEFMASPDYLKLPPPVQNEFVIHRAEHQMAQLLKMERALADQAAIAEAASPVQEAASPQGEAAPPPAPPRGATAAAPAPRRAAR